MLKIDVTEARMGQRVTVRLEGQMVGRWVDEVRQACEPFLSGGQTIVLDFTAVSFVDRNGVALCRRLRLARATLRNCSPFVKEQIDA
ncbi:MAG TPA: STAS domain-containing protein [Methylomirabilota bacterium]|nr:STAS domain-containing protein [Methylomirabilota bacterium]